MSEAKPGPENARLVAELWYQKVPNLHDPSLLSAVRSLSLAAEAQEGSLTIPHSGVTMELEGGPMPLVTAVLAASPLDHGTKRLPDASQTWDWEEAELALMGCTGSVLVTELQTGRMFTPQQRVAAFLAVVGVLVDQTEPSVLSWPNSQRLTDPGVFDPDALDGVLNVRFFTVSNDEGALVMDTLGLHVFDLPDVQCHYREFDAAALASMLFATAVYQFEHGDVIDDGHTISGPRGDERFVCRHEMSLMGPTREVLDVDLGEPFAAGVRRRTAES